MEVLAVSEAIEGRGGCER